MLDYLRLACAVPTLRVADVTYNTQKICEKIAEADAKDADLIVFPELAITGYSCADLFMQKSLQEAAKKGLCEIVAFSAEYPAVTAVVGVPLLIDDLLYNCAAVISGGELRGLVPKVFLPDYGEFSEKRWFASGLQLNREHMEVRALGIDGYYSVPVGSNQTFRMAEGAVLGVEVCEDLWAPVAPSAQLALSGAHVIVNPAASNALAGKRQYRTNRVKEQSAVCKCAYAFCSAGSDESTQDMVWSGHSVVAQDGKILAENQNVTDTDYLLVTDIDLGVIGNERTRNTSFRDAAALYATAEPTPHCYESLSAKLRGDGTLYPVWKLPFVPQTQAQRQARCEEIFQIQVAGLKKRLATIGAKAVIGISGGLDSTLALLVAVEAMRQLGRPMTDVYGVTMPCFGTSDRTYQNAWSLMKLLGISCCEVNIRDAVMQHFTDIGHDPEKHDATYENAQARERTQILMDKAGEVGGIVVGTGDLSELALGWCTYNGDHMSMYGVNGSVPKTLIRWIIDTVAQMPAFAQAGAVLQDILDTPISPELLPPDATGKISQQTEDIVGPYALHDFFLYYVLRYGFAPRKIYHLACRAFQGDFDGATVKKWLVVFYRRFFTQQFKRNCQPDGVKVGTVSVSPRGDWRMPSDAAAKLWLEEAESL